MSKDVKEMNEEIVGFETKSHTFVMTLKGCVDYYLKQIFTSFFDYNYINLEKK